MPDDQEERGTVGEQVRGEQITLACPRCYRTIHPVLRYVWEGPRSYERETLVWECPYCHLEGTFSWGAVIKDGERNGN